MPLNLQEALHKSVDNLFSEMVREEVNQFKVESVTFRVDYQQQAIHSKAKVAYTVTSHVPFE